MHLLAHIQSYEIYRMTFMRYLQGYSLHCEFLFSCCKLLNHSLKMATTLLVGRPESQNPLNYTYIFP